MSETELDFAAQDKGEFVCVKAKVPKLKAKTKLFGQKTEKAKNFEIERPVFQERRFSIVVRGKSDTSGQNYKLDVPLRYNINVADCYIQTEDGFIDIYLKKTDPDQSWEAEIRKGLVHQE